MKPRVAIIGSGIAGLTLARALAPRAEVTVFEKARGPGGRMSVRRGPDHTFDHGAQYFTARDPAFAAFLIPLMRCGAVQRWQGNTVYLDEAGNTSPRPQSSPYYVAAPGMNALCKWLAEGVTVQAGVEIAPFETPTPSGNHVLRSATGEPAGEYDWVISTAPPAQTARLLGEAVPQDHPVRSVKMHCCYALMLGFETPPSNAWMAAEVTGDVALQWISAEHHKPGRNSAAAFTAHARHDWSDAHENDDQQQALALLESRFHALMGTSFERVAFRSLHRWRYAARADEAVTHSEPLLLTNQRLAACGDWQGPSRVENAWLRARALADLILC